jgi:hypothetical protein
MLLSFFNLTSIAPRLTHISSRILLNRLLRLSMARGRIASPVDEEEDHDLDVQDQGASRKRQRTNGNGKKAAPAAAGGDAGSDSDGELLSEDEEALAEALRGWTVDSFTDKPVQATKVVLQQVSEHHIFTSRPFATSHRLHMLLRSAPEDAAHAAESDRNYGQVDNENNRSCHRA